MTVRTVATTLSVILICTAATWGGEPVSRAGLAPAVKAGILIGSVGGSLLGVFGGLIGTLVGCGRGRRFVLTAMKVAIALGAILLIAGIAAVLASHPYALYYPLLLLGLLCVAINGSLYRVARNRYEQDELRRMRALDAK
ncbi:MAG TPA: hypothetical protein VFJ30_05165 [Phycisphaerae bacterium]|nr:hypothetical protein [Phycisphaerae bacterium]